MREEFEKYFDDYQNDKLVEYDQATDFKISFGDLPERRVDGVLKGLYRDENDELVCLFSQKMMHKMILASTASGKTTSCIIPEIQVQSRLMDKRSFLISDPKGEIYRNVASELKNQGYNVIVYNFRNSRRSEKWNFLLPIYDHYIQIVNELLCNEECIDTYDDLLDEISEIAYLIFPKNKQERDPYWTDSARNFLQAMIWAMLAKTTEEYDAITRNEFSMRTMIRLYDGLSFGDESVCSNSFFEGDSVAARMARGFAKCVFENAPNTRYCILSMFASGISFFRKGTIKQITESNSLEYEQLLDGPTAIFISYPDESKSCYSLIKMFVQGFYMFLIKEANEKSDGKLEREFMFFLDEFGNFPQIPDFDTTISACRARGIYFTIVLQSYAQLDNVYDVKTAEIIKDNLNMHIFMGSNNMDTLNRFSLECGKKSRLAPCSALEGGDNKVTHWNLESIPVLPVSKLRKFEEGEAIVVEQNCPYILKTKLIRFYQVPEFICEESDLGKYNFIFRVKDRKDEEYDPDDEYCF